MVVKRIEIKNRTYYFWNDIVYVEDFDPLLVKVDKKEFQDSVDLFFIGYVVKSLNIRLIA